MQEKVVFHLFIPSFLKLFSQSYQDVLSDVDAPQLLSLLTQFTFENKEKSSSVDQSFFNAISPNTEELPIAYYRYQIQLNSVKTSIMCADPVFFQVGMNDITLKHKVDDLSTEEAKELIRVLNAHFIDDGLQFIFGSNECWYVSFDDNEEITSCEIDSVLMGNIRDKLAKSSKRNWQVIQNEVQMLLHASDVNQFRERAGLTPINSLWFWGAGRPGNSNVKVGSVFSTENSKALLRGDIYAKVAGCERKALPNTSQQMQSLIDNASHKQFFILDGFFIPTLENTTESIEQIKITLLRLDDVIIGPLLKAWKSNNIEVVIDCCDGTILKPQKVLAWKFWQKPKKLMELFDEIST